MPENDKATKCQEQKTREIIMSHPAFIGWAGEAIRKIHERGKPLPEITLLDVEKLFAKIYTKPPNETEN